MNHSTKKSWICLHCHGSTANNHRWRDFFILSIHCKFVPFLRESQNFIPKRSLFLRLHQFKKTHLLHGALVFLRTEVGNSRGDISDRWLEFGGNLKDSQTQDFLISSNPQTSISTKHFREFESSYLGITLYIIYVYIHISAWNTLRPRITPEKRYWMDLVFNVCHESWIIIDMRIHPLWLPPFWCRYLPPPPHPRAWR